MIGRRIAFAAVVLAVWCTTVSHGQVTYELVKGFDAPFLDGYAPSTLIQATDGRLYGTAGGGLGFGTIFRLETDGGLTTLHRFTNGVDGGSPTGLMQGADGNFYGTAGSGGGFGGGTVFKLDGAGTLTTLHAFNPATEGAGPAAGVIQATDGSFYGTTKGGGAFQLGTVFKLAAGTVTTLHAFAGGAADGATPVAGVIQATDGDLYGTTEAGGPNGYGSVFRIDVAGNFATLRLLAYGDGTRPEAGLLQATNGLLYGMTVSGGGGSDIGTVFTISMAGLFTKIHTFSGLDGRGPVSALIQGDDGKFYGSTTAGTNEGIIFRMDAAGTVTTIQSLGDNLPTAGVIQGADGALYGTTQPSIGGASTGESTVFKREASGIVTTLHTFTINGGAAYPSRGGLIQASDGDFYGTTSRGGPANAGTAFKVTPAGTLTTLHAFESTPGAPGGSSPESGLVQAADGFFYGSTGGGTGSGGTIFRIDAAGSLSTIYSLDFFADGYGPARLIQATDGRFYGATENGTVFKVDSSGNFAKLHRLSDSEGIAPLDGVVQGSDGSFYGTASAGGSGSRGTVFKVDAAGALTVLHAFAGPEDSGFPQATVIEGIDGYLYGTTLGRADKGTIFRIDPAGVVTMLYRFRLGERPNTRLMQAADGSFYGTTSQGGAFAAGTVFRFDPTSRVLATLYQFTGGADGAGPTGGLLFATDGKLYGTTATGGPTAGGTVFRLSVAPAGLSLAATSVEGCLKTKGTVTLSSPAPVGGLVVQLSSNNSHAIVPATVTVPAAALTATFSISTAAVASTETATITATTFGVSSPGATLTLTPLTVKSVELSASTVVGGSTVGGTVILQCAAGPGNLVVALSSTMPAAAFPASPTVMVPFGMKTAAFTVTTQPVATKTKPVIQATLHGVTRSRALLVTP